MTEKLADLYVPIIADGQAFLDSIKKVETTAKTGGTKVAASFGSTFQSGLMKYVGPAALAGAVAAGVTATIQAVANEARMRSGAIRQFNQEMTSLLSLGDNLTNFQKVEDRVKSLSVTMGIGNGSVAGAMFAVESAAANLDKEIQTGIITSSLKLQKVTGEDLAGIIRALTKTFQNFGETQADVGKIMDQLSMSAQLGDTTFGQLASSFPKVAASANIYNRELQETLGAFSLVTQLLGGVEVSATGLVATFRDIDRAITSGIIKSTGSIVGDIEEISKKGDGVFKKVFSDEAKPAAQAIASSLKEMADYTGQIAVNSNGIVDSGFFNTLRNPSTNFASVAASIESAKQNQLTDPNSRFAKISQSMELSKLGQREQIGFEIPGLASLFSAIDAIESQITGEDSESIKQGKKYILDQAKATGDKALLLAKEVELGMKTLEEAEKEFKAIQERVESEKKATEANDKAADAIENKAQIIQEENAKAAESTKKKTDASKSGLLSVDDKGVNPFSGTMGMSQDEYEKKMTRFKNWVASNNEQLHQRAQGDTLFDKAHSAYKRNPFNPNDSGPNFRPGWSQIDPYSFGPTVGPTLMTHQRQSMQTLSNNRQGNAFKQYGDWLYGGDLPVVNGGRRQNMGFTSAEDYNAGPSASRFNSGARMNGGGPSVVLNAQYLTLQDPQKAVQFAANQRAMSGGEL